MASFPSQSGFRKNRGTIDMVFAARQMQGRCQEQNSDLYSTYVDLTKAFDTVSTEGLWRIIAKSVLPPKNHHHSSTAARWDAGESPRRGESSEPFSVSNIVKQDCVLAPTLFSFMFSAMLTDAFDGTVQGNPLSHEDETVVIVATDGRTATTKKPNKKHC